ncbi:MAG: ABC transporter ATP-binding protein [Propionibacteriaceae bacterium]|nr:ABC transporter ATP-binding protein [Propionibacteriaceae bacterium]
MAELYRVESLCRRFGGAAAGVDALAGVDFQIAAGERLGIVGESGSGKTTLVRLLAALDRPTSGRVVFDGMDTSNAPESALRRFRARVQPVFQDPRSSLNPRMRVGDIVGEPLRSLRVAHTSGRVGEVLADVGLEPEAGKRYPHEFSGGQRQRIAIARALAPEPQVLIADEPVSALDVLVRGQIVQLLADLVATRRLTLIVVSHDLSVVRDLCERAMVLRQGKIVERGPVGQLLAGPRSEYARSLLAAIPELPE